MSITTIPNELILHIGNFSSKKMLFNHDTGTSRTLCPIWNLYASCKSFSWLEKFEYLCVEISEHSSNHCQIISRNINSRFDGICYQKMYRTLIGYCGSDKPKEGYNYSKWSIQDKFFYREDFETAYFDYDYNRHRNINSRESATCVRYEYGSCKKCTLCTQLDTIQLEIFEKDSDVADILKNSNNYKNGRIIIREKKPMLNFKFDYTGFNRTSQ